MNWNELAIWIMISLLELVEHTCFLKKELCSALANLTRPVVKGNLFKWLCFRTWTSHLPIVMMVSFSIIMQTRKMDIMPHTDPTCHPPIWEVIEKNERWFKWKPSRWLFSLWIIKNSVDPVVRNRPAKFQNFLNFYHRNCSFLLCSFINLSKKVFGRELTR